MRPDLIIMDPWIFKPEGYYIMGLMTDEIPAIAIVYKDNLDELWVLTSGF